MSAVRRKAVIVVPGLRPDNQSRESTRVLSECASVNAQLTGIVEPPSPAARFLAKPKWECPIDGTFVEQAPVHRDGFGGRDHFLCIDGALSVGAGGVRGRK